MAEQYKPQDAEAFVMNFWEDNKVYQKLKKRNAGKKVFFYLDGPPYTTGRIHIGHAWGKALRDSILRYKRMAGFDVWDQPGFDMHGLPIEKAVEKELGITSKKEIVERVGVEQFISKCRAFGLEQMKPMIKDFARLGVWMEWDRPYMTIKNEYVEGAWWALAQAQKKGLLYKGKRTMTWCAGCATALAKHELEYENRKDPSLFLKFKVENEPDTFLIIWTTTPWTLPFNMAVMANPEADYVVAEIESTKEKWILAKALHIGVIGAVAGEKFKVIKELKGEELEGKRYEHPFKDLQYHQNRRKDTENAYTVILSDKHVGLDAGSGLVHCAPGCGAEDFEVGKEYDIPPYNDVDEHGVFPSSMEYLAGLRAKVDDAVFVEQLRKRGNLIDAGEIEHEYPLCWRSKDPVIFRATEQWFLAVEQLRETMRTLNKDVRWTPEWAGNKWFDSWLSNLQDWCISRQRFWGIPLPIWINDEGDYLLVGSKAELEKLSGQTVNDLHRPWIDDVEIVKDGKTYTRVPDVLDVWLDSGAAPWATLDYPSKTGLLEKLGTPDLILEGKDQIRGWFNSLSCLSMVSFGRIPFKAVYMHGFINDAQGRKFSKSLKTGVSPYEVIDQHGADTLRYYTISSAQPGLDLSYNPEDVKTKVKNLLVLWNLHNFVIDLADQLGQNPTRMEDTVMLAQLETEERYMFSRINSTTKKVTQLFEEYALNQVPGAVDALIGDLSRTYIQMVREKANGSDDERAVVLYTSYHALMRAIELFAPICPFITEAIFQRLRVRFTLPHESVHLHPWPNVSENAIDYALEENMVFAQQIIQAALYGREKCQRSLRWPLPRLYVVTQETNSIKAVEQLRDAIKRQTNCKEVLLQTNIPEVKETITLNRAMLGKSFGASAKNVEAELAKKNLAAVYREVVGQGTSTLKHPTGVAELNTTHFNVERLVPQHLVEVSFPGGLAYVDNEVTPALEAEGFSREITRRLQQLRKDTGLTKNQRVHAHIVVDAALVKGLQPFGETIAQKVNAKSLTIADTPPSHSYTHSAQATVKGKPFTLHLDVVE